MRLFTKKPSQFYWEGFFVWSTFSRFCHRILAGKALYSIRQRRECKVADAHGRYQRVQARFRAYCTLWLTQCIQIIQHNHRAFVKPKILHWEFYLAVLNIKSPVAGKASLQNCLRVYTAYVPELGNKNAFVGTLNQIIQAVIGTHHNNAIGCRYRFNTFLFGPIP